jgi:uncharacterized membrane protein YagU involved in acid resistance
MEVTMARTAVDFRYSDIVLAGIVSGTVFAGFEMIAAAVLTGPQDFYMPLRMIGATVLGPAALDPGYSLAVAGLVGVIVHAGFSVACALIFAVFASPGASTAALTAGGIAFGIVLWLVIFYVVAPLAGWTWFPDRTNPAVQFVAHAFFFGCPVGWYLGRSRASIVPPGA